jgi:hypothetical protein
LNQQQFRNHKYKHKETSEARVVDDRGQSEQTPIDVDAMTLSPGTKLYVKLSLRKLITSNEATRANKPSVAAGESATPDLPDLDQFLDEQPSSPGRVILNGADVYEVPTSTPSSPSVSFLPVQMTLANWDVAYAALPVNKPAIRNQTGSYFHRPNLQGSASEASEETT